MGKTGSHNQDIHPEQSQLLRTSPLGHTSQPLGKERVSENLAIVGPARVSEKVESVQCMMENVTTEMSAMEQLFISCHIVVNERLKHGQSDTRVRAT